MENKRLSFFRIDPKKLSDLVNDSNIPEGTIIKVHQKEHVVRDTTRKFLAHLVSYDTQYHPSTIVKTHNPSHELSIYLRKYII